MPFTSNQKLKIGYYTDDGWFQACPTSTRAVLKAVEVLRNGLLNFSTIFCPHGFCCLAGHEVVEWKPPDLSKVSQLFAKIMSADGNFDGYIRGCEGEALNPLYSTLYVLANLPPTLRTVLSNILIATGQERAGKMMKVTGAKSAVNHFESLGELKTFCSSYKESWLYLYV